MNVKDENHGPGVNIENEFVQIGRRKQETYGWLVNHP